MIISKLLQVNITSNNYFVRNSSFSQIQKDKCQCRNISPESLKLVYVCQIQTQIHILYFLINRKIFYNQAMIPNSQTNISTQIFLTKLKLYLNSAQISFEEYFANFQTINRKQLSKLQFFRVVSLLHIDTLRDFAPMQAFNRLSDNKQTIEFTQLKRFYDENKAMERKGKQKIVEDKAKDQQIRKKLVKISAYKIEQFLKKCENPVQLLQQFDIDGNKALSKQQFNSFLLATGIKQLTNREIRRILIDHLYKYFRPKTEISFDELFHIFRVNPQKYKIQEPGNNVFQKQAQTKNNMMKKKDQFLKLPQEQSPPVFQGTQTNKNDQNDKATDNYFSQGAKMFPNAIKFYRLGQPIPCQHQFLEQLENLLKNKIMFLDKENPKAQGIYADSNSIFHDKFFIFQMASSVLMRQKSRIGIARQIEPKDIIQGQIGDCYFLSSIASIISIYPQLISQKFLFDANSSGYYAIKMFIDGEWKVVKTDDRFPCKNGKPMYAKPHRNQIWVLLLQKCWAKLFGSYKAIESGSSKEGFLALTGAPSVIINIETQEQDSLIKQLQNAQGKRHVAAVSGSNYLASLSSNQQQKLGLISGHAYSFLKMIKIGQVSLIKMRNPWGKTIWSGDWSFQSHKWTKQLRDKYNYNKNPEDGSFYIPWGQFTKYFGEVVICKLNSTFTHESVRIHSNKKKSSYFKMIVKNSGSYTISIYQQSKRKFRGYKNYEFAPARLIIMKKQNEGLKYVCAKATNQSLSCNIEAELEEGVYIISAKVFWKFWPDHDFVLTSYGPEKVQFINVNRDIAPLFKSSLIKSYANQYKNTGKVKGYQKYDLQAFCETNFSMQTGIGFIRMVGLGGKPFESTYEMKITGLKVIKPEKLPFTFKVIAGSEFVIGFFVNPGGYQYNSSQKIKF